MKGTDVGDGSGSGAQRADVAATGDVDAGVRAGASDEPAAGARGAAGPRSGSDNGDKGCARDSCWRCTRCPPDGLGEEAAAGASSAGPMPRVVAAGAPARGYGSSALTHSPHSLAADWSCGSHPRRRHTHPPPTTLIHTVNICPGLLGYPSLSVGLHP